MFILQNLKLKLSKKVYSFNLLYFSYFPDYTLLRIYMYVSCFLCFLQLSQIMSSAGFEPPHLWSEVKHSYCSATDATSNGILVIVLSTTYICTNGSVSKGCITPWKNINYKQLSQYVITKPINANANKRIISKKYVRQNKLLNFLNYVCIFFTKLFVKNRYYVNFIASI